MAAAFRDAFATARNNHTEEQKGKNVSTTNRTIGVGLISVGWMGKLHSRAYRNVPIVYPELGIKPKLVIAADTAPAGSSSPATSWASPRAPPITTMSSTTPTWTSCPSAPPTSSTPKSASPQPKPASTSGSKSRSDAATRKPPPSGRRHGGGSDHLIGYNYRHAPAVEHARELIADGKLGRITNVRAVFFSGYASEPNGALSWRFDRELAGTGVLADLFSHASDLCQYVVGPIAEVTALTSTVYTSGPSSRWARERTSQVIENGEMGEVENEDYAAALVRFGPPPGRRSRRHHRVVPRRRRARVRLPDRGLWHRRVAQMGLRAHERAASSAWAQQRRAGLHHRQRQPAPRRLLPLPARTRQRMGFDDLKVIEAKKFLVAVAADAQENSNIHDAASAAAIVSAAEASACPVSGRRSRTSPAPRHPGTA